MKRLIRIDGYESSVRRYSPQILELQRCYFLGDQNVSKISLIKELRFSKNIGLKEAKEEVESWSPCENGEIIFAEPNLVADLHFTHQDSATVKFTLPHPFYEGREFQATIRMDTFSNCFVVDHNLRWLHFITFKKVEALFLQKRNEYIEKKILERKRWLELKQDMESKRRRRELDREYWKKQPTWKKKDESPGAKALDKILGKNLLGKEWK